MRRPMKLIAGVMLAALASGAAAQGYPDRSVRVIIPYPPGGSTDLLGRTVAQKLTEVFGHQAVPDNRPGAGGNVGAEIAAKSPPDGYTILLAPVSPMAINVSLYAGRMKFNPETDFAPITLVANVPLLLVGAAKAGPRERAVAFFSCISLCCRLLGAQKMTMCCTHSIIKVL